MFLHFTVTVRISQMLQEFVFVRCVEMESHSLRACFLKYSVCVGFCLVDGTVYL